MKWQMSDDLYSEYSEKGDNLQPLILKFAAEYAEYSKEIRKNKTESDVTVSGLWR
jgi:hypothetical protein